MLKVDENYIAPASRCAAPRPGGRSRAPSSSSLLCAAHSDAAQMAIGDPSLIGLVTRIAIYAIAAANLALLLG